MVVELEGRDHGVPERGRIGHLGDADGRTEVGRLDEDRQSQSAATASSMTSLDHDDRATSLQAATGSPWSCSTDLAMPLSMQMADESTPAPT